RGELGSIPTPPVHLPHRPGLSPAGGNRVLRVGLRHTCCRAGSAGRVAPVVYDIPVSLRYLAGLAIEHVHDREKGRRFALGIAGPPAAGKSTLAASLRNQINTQSGRRIAEVAPMDGFHLSNTTLTASGKLWRKGAPDTFAVAELAALLMKAREQGAEDIAW